MPTPQIERIGTNLKRADLTKFKVWIIATDIAKDDTVEVKDLGTGDIWDAKIDKVKLISGNRSKGRIKLVSKRVTGTKKTVVDPDFVDLEVTVTNPSGPSSKPVQTGAVIDGPD